MTNDPFQHDGAAPEGREAEPLDGGIPDELVDRFFDREISASDRARLFGALDSDAGICERMARLSFVLSRMKKGVRAPDLSDQILDRVDRVRGFVPASRRPLVRLGRLAVAASMFGLIAGAVIVRRSAPEVVEMGQPMPLRDVARAAERDTGGFGSLASSMASTVASSGFSRVSGVAGQDSTVEWRVERAGWSEGSDAGRRVSWSWSPAAACGERPIESEARVVVVGGRVIAIELGATARGVGLDEESGVFVSEGRIVPVSLKPKPDGRCVRDARLSDLP